ncbi:MAG TPA: phosphodiester glycosidase family protein [Pyrinomonadaceae bacterium]|nr:phosphodiester glycosidase family protein [Pyrinomonadaceae bacterium]
MKKKLSLRRRSKTGAPDENQNKILPARRQSFTDARSYNHIAVGGRRLNAERTLMFDSVSMLVSLLCILCALGGNSFAQEWKKIHEGVEYAHVDHKIGGEPVKINLLRLDLTKVRLDVHHALDAGIGVEPTSSIAKRHNAVAAINGGFFRLDTSIWAGDAAGVLKIDGKFLSEPSNERIALMIKNYPASTKIWFHHARLFVALKTGKKQISISGLNRERRQNDSVLYTPEFGRTTLTDGTGLEVVVSGKRITKIADSRGSNEIPRDGFVLSVTGTRADELRQIVKLKSRANVQYGDFTSNTDPLVFMDQIRSGEGLPGVGISDDITNGVPQLIKNGKIDITWEQEKASKSFAEMRHPRTAVAKLKDGQFLMITVDGRQPGVSVGMNLQELAEYILSLGASDAMNLDGGGSTTMYVDGKVLNTPSEKDGERKVSDAIVVTLRKNSRR